MIEARFVAAVCAASVNQKSPIDRSEFVRPVPEPDDEYTNECELLLSKASLASIN
jgi:hypothetical protein